MCEKSAVECVRWDFRKVKSIRIETRLTERKLCGVNRNYFQRAEYPGPQPATATTLSLPTKSCDAQFL